MRRLHYWNYTVSVDFRCKTRDQNPKKQGAIAPAREPARATGRRSARRMARDQLDDWLAPNLVSMRSHSSMNWRLVTLSTPSGNCARWSWGMSPQIARRAQAGPSLTFGGEIHARLVRPGFHVHGSTGYALLVQHIEDKCPGGSDMDALGITQRVFPEIFTTSICSRNCAAPGGSGSQEPSMTACVGWHPAHTLTHNAAQVAGNG
jgi:hypothetical protein